MSAIYTSADQLIKAYGAEIVLTEGAKGMKGAIAKAEELAAEIHYRQQEQPAAAYPQPDGHVVIVFERPQRAITPGQAVVIKAGTVKRRRSSYPASL